MANNEDPDKKVTFHQGLHCLLRLNSLQYSRSSVQKYSKSSKILNASCLLKKPRRTVQTQIRLLLKKQSDQGLICLLFRQAFCEF